MICDKRIENHNFTITTNTSQHAEFFHSLIFDKIHLLYVNLNINKKLESISPAKYIDYHHSIQSVSTM